MPTTNPYQIMNQYPYLPYNQTATTHVSQPQQNNNITWVQGIEGARAYPVAPNNAVALWDSDSSTVYIKMADASGVPQPLRILDYTERVQTQENQKDVDAVSTDQLNDALNALEDRLTKLITSSHSYKKGGRNNGKSTVQPSES